MALPGGLLGTLWSEFVTVISWVFGTLWRWLGIVFGGSLSVLWNGVVWLVGTLFGLLWGWVLFGILLGCAVVLNVLGVKDVYTTLFRRIDRDDTSQTAHQTVPDVSPEEVTDESGRFSPVTFRRVTGMTPAEFIHLFVKSNGGRVRQKTINTCLPWSKTTVSRLLDTLEDEGLIERVPVGRENVVRIPDEDSASQS